MTNLTWIGFKEFLFKKFMLEYQELGKGMNLVQMKHTRFLKAYVHDFNAQMNAILKVNELAKRYIILNGL